VAKISAWRGCRRGCREQFIHAAEESVRPAGYGGGTSERLRLPGAVLCRLECKCSHLVARKLILCALCADAMCICSVCASCAAEANIDMLCQQHATGRAAVLQQSCQWLFASGNVFLYETRCDRQRSSSCDRTLLASVCSARPAPPRTAATLPMVHHLLTVVVGRVS